MATEPHGESEVVFLRIHEKRPLIVLAVATAPLVGIVGPASAQFFNFGGPGAAAGSLWTLRCPNRGGGPQAGKTVFGRGREGGRSSGVWSSWVQRAYQKPKVARASIGRRRRRDSHLDRLRSI